MKKLLIAMACLISLSSFASAVVLNDAISWMYNNGLTIHNNTTDFKVDNGLRRDEAAKFFVNFSYFLGKTSHVKTASECTFLDINDSHADLKDTVIESCKLGLLKGNKEKFRPRSPLTNAEAITILVRLLAGNQSEVGGSHRADNYYTKANKLGVLQYVTMNSKDTSATRGNVGIIIYNAKTTITTDTSDTTDTDTTTDTSTSNNEACAIFPSHHPINQKITDLPVHPKSQQIVDKITARRNSLHPDFGADRDGGPFGIPFVYVNAQTTRLEAIATDYADESDEGNFPIPLNAPIEKGGDKHVIAVDTDACMLYEIFNASISNNKWYGSSIAKFDMTKVQERPVGWTSADAAGLPIFPLLARYEEVKEGVIPHALRCTFSKTQKKYIRPATHYASSSTDPLDPPMGMRFRLKASYDLSNVVGQAKVVATALKEYGCIVADNGSDRYISGAPDSRRDDEDLNQIKRIPGTAFEVVDTE